MTATARQPQPGVPRAHEAAGLSMEFDLAGEPAAARRALAGLAPGGSVVGLGAPLVAAMGGHVAGLESFAAIGTGPVFPGTQRACWTFVSAADPSAAFDEARRLAGALAPALSMVESTILFRYRNDRELLGYRDGLANPPAGPEALAAAIVAEGPVAGGSFAVTQRYLYAPGAFHRLPPAGRDAVIGRDNATDEELDDAPDTAHVKRTEQEHFAPGGTMLRHSMPWGDARRHGLQFIGFSAQPNLARRMLERMAGLEDGIVDALLDHVVAETGGYYFCPPLLDGKLDLSGLGLPPA